METTVTAHSEDMEAIAEAILRTACASVREGACLIALRGPIGAGKTTLAQAMGRHLGVVEHIASPTFVIQKRYNIARAPYTTLVHIDAYRIEDPREALVLGFEELCRDPHTIIILEWPEHIADLLPRRYLDVSCAHDTETTRIISYTLHEKTA